MLNVNCRVCFDRGVVLDYSGCNRVCPSCHGLSLFCTEGDEAPSFHIEPINVPAGRNLPTGSGKTQKPKHRL